VRDFVDIKHNSMQQARQHERATEQKVQEHNQQ
jgi:hypothetical protein